MIGRLTNPYRQLESKLGYRFRRRALLATALVHRSYRFETPDVLSDNQRLEFLGDAVLGLLAGEFLYREFDVAEGDLTSMRSLLARGATLARLGRELGLDAFLQVGKGERKCGGHQRASNLGDCLEAILGAAYLDGGVKACQKIFDKVFLPAINDLLGQSGHNPKGELQEVCQRRWRRGPEYCLADRLGPAHAIVFTSRVALPDGLEATGTGPSKRVAEEAAARRALELLGAEGAAGDGDRP